MLSDNWLKNSSTERLCMLLQKLSILFRLGWKAKIHRVIVFDQSRWLNTYTEFNKQRNNRSKENDGKKDGRAG